MQFDHASAAGFASYLSNMHGIGSAFVAWTRRQMVSLRGRSIPVEVEYLWFSGAVISTPHALRRGQKVEITLRPDVARIGVVTFGRDRRYTCLFDKPIPHDEAEGGHHGYGVARIVG